MRVCMRGKEIVMDLTNSNPKTKNIILVCYTSVVKRFIKFRKLKHIHARVKSWFERISSMIGLIP